MDSVRGVWMPIDVVISPTDHRVTVCVQGELDAATAGQLSAVLEHADDAPHLVVDLAGSEFVDIPGMRAIAECAMRRREQGRRELMVAAPPPSAETILRMTPWRAQLRWEPRNPGDG
jgi:anti-anti-sigma factor